MDPDLAVPLSRVGRPRPLGLLLLLGVVGCADGGPGPGPAVSAAAGALIDGTSASGDGAAVALLDHGRGYCTGALIAPRTVATAAHCVGEQRPTAVYFGVAPAWDEGVVIAAQRVAIHPDYVPAGEGSRAHADLALVFLAHDAPADATPWALADEGRPPTVEPGQALRLVGFGRPVGSPRKTTGIVRVSALDDDGIFHEADPVTICAGDSGGPALATLDGREYLVGIASAGVVTCDGPGRHTRIDVAYREFLRHHLDGAFALGEACFDDTQCASGSCVDAIDAAAFAYCSHPCGDDADCDAGLGCVVDGRGVRACRPATEPGAPTAACALPEDCTSGYCERLEGGPPQCTLRCTASDAITCPSGLKCVQRADGVEFCAASHDGKPEGTTGCRSTAGRRHRGGDAAGLLALALASLLARRRHRRRRLCGTMRSGHAPTAPTSLRGSPPPP